MVLRQLARLATGTFTAATKVPVEPLAEHLPS